jgi:hypothetical protein
MAKSRRQRVVDRAGNRCEYCQMPQHCTSLPHELVPLFNPRTDIWPDHFEWNGPTIVGKTAIGRATIDVLNINDTLRVEHRRLLIQTDQFPSVSTE